MGRGRAKAKQTKVARQLKYSGGGTDLDRLRAELTGGSDSQRPLADPKIDGAGDDADDEYADPYADVYADDDYAEDDDESATGTRR
jgi:Protein of unknown function (DUF3073)